MLFNSYEYLIFLPVVFALYWLFPQKYRWILLLGASYFFYMSWKAEYLALIVFVTVESYIASVMIENTRNNRGRKIILILSILISLSLLLVFKYFNFFALSINKVFEAFRSGGRIPLLEVILPVGISFYTFQALSYVVDVYRGKVKAEKNLGIYATFVSFFPQLVAGPIERTSNLLPQIKRAHSFEYQKAVYGMRLMLWGYFKKLVIADNLSPFVERVFNDPYSYNGFALILGTVFFTFQIYCDFSGYSDIAIGTAKLFGIDLMTNFKSPYYSTSIKEFWNRWHISLSTWFKDYVYIPLGGNRVSKLRNYLNYLITFLVSGLWHGANWTFVIWGAIHGLVQIIENAFGRTGKHVLSIPMRVLKTIIIFGICSLAWIFFVSHSLSEAFYVVTHLFTGLSSPSLYMYNGFKAIQISKFELAILIMSTAVLAIYDFLSLKRDCIDWLNKSPGWLRHAVTLLFIMLTITLRYNGQAEFVYFQF